MNVSYKPLPNLFRRQPNRHSFARAKYVARLQREAAILKAPEARKRKDRRRFPSRVRSTRALFSNQQVGITEDLQEQDGCDLHYRKRANQLGTHSRPVELGMFPCTMCNPIKRPINATR